eukprot:6057659-Pyramimonas_sp.AAC.1
MSTPASTTIPGMNTTKKMCRIRTTSGYLGGPDTTMDYIGQMRGHLQDEYGPMYYWLTRIPWGTDAKTDWESCATTAFSLPFLNEDDVPVIISMR